MHNPWLEAEQPPGNTNEFDASMSENGVVLTKSRFCVDYVWSYPWKP